MSAYKTAYIRLGEAEYKKLRAAEEQLRMNKLLHMESINLGQDQERTIYENMMGIKNQNDRYFQKMGVDIEGEISRIEKEASNWVESQTYIMQNELMQYRERIRDDASIQIADFIASANRQIQQKEIELNSYWHIQEERIKSYENRWAQYASQALNWIHKDQQILEFIYDTYQIDAQMANNLELQRQYLDQVIQHYNNGFFEIAATAGFQLFINLSNSHSELEVNRAVQNIRYQNLLNKTRQLQASIESSRSVHAMDADGNELPENIDVNYWVEGRFEDFYSEVEDMVANIFSDETLGLEKITAYDRQLEIFSDRLIDLVTKARVVVLASQLRFNVAQIIVNALESQGFFLDQADYEKGDYRESFVAKTSNISGNEVLVTIDPDPGLDEGGKLHIQSLDANQITEHELLQRNFEIFNAIQENGIDVGDIQEVKLYSPGSTPIQKSELNSFNGYKNKVEERSKHGRY